VDGELKMSIGFKSSFLIKPMYTFPPNWPRGWDFPSEAPPPGYPKKFTGPHKLDAHFKDGILTVAVRNEFNEVTDDLNGEFLRIDCDSRMRQSADGQWKKVCLFGIDNIGIVEALLLEKEAPLRISLAGWEGLEVVV